MRMYFLFLFFTLSFYGQNDTISVIKHTDEDLIVDKYSKVVYRGINNSLSIEVPNCKSFTATADGLIMVSKNLYNLNPLSGLQVIITVDIILKNNKKKTEKHVFEIKGVSGFATTINGRNGFVRMQKKQFLDAIIKVRFEDKNLTFSSKVSVFYLKIPGMPSIEIIGNKIDSMTYEKILKNSSIGDHIIISNVKLNVTEPILKGYMCFKTTPIVIEIY